ncbi:MAG: hypothetical protein EHM55_26410 [Acidobacteria bacterium]|nr:MAG: hypothetical protein EHM55_26410 [Acidobacteriota bacterium]
MCRVAGRVALALLTVVPALPASGQSMEESLSKAYVGNPTLQSGRARLRATDEGVPQALSGWRPTVSMSYEVGKGEFYSNSATTTSRTSQRTSRSGGVTVTQNLYRGNRTTASVSRAENLVFAERARLTATEQDVMLQAATAYMDVVRDQAVLDLNVNNERVLQRQLEATRDRFQVGEVTRTDVAQAESRLSRATSDRIGSAGNLIKSRAAYRNVVGEMPGTLRAAAPLGDLPANEEEAITFARDQNPGVVAARFDERAAQNQVDVVFGELLPSVDLEGTLERNDGSSFRGSRSEEASVNAVLRVPLYQGGSVSARVREAKETLSQRRKDLERTVRTSIETATRAWEALQTARSQIRAFDDEVRAAEIALEGIRQEAQVGSRTVLDVLNAEQELVDARVNLVRAQHDEVVATFSLRSAVGTLTADRLALNVDRYDVDGHYRAVRGKWIGTGVDGQ